MLHATCYMKRFWLHCSIVTLLVFVLPTFVQAEMIDSDGDGLSDEREKVFYTDPANPDTDGDGYLDGLEVDNGYSPHAGEGIKIGQYDYDEDGLSDWLELWFNSSIGLVDTDSDGVNDFEEVMEGHDPTDPDNKKNFERRIEVDRTHQRLYYYVDKVKLFNFPVSTGNPWTPTPEGEFSVMRKIDNKRYIGPGYNLPGVKWNLEFLPTYYIHTAYWHDNFGERTMSHGCVNMREADVGMLYKYLDIGVPVKIIGETPQNRQVGV